MNPIIMPVRNGLGLTKKAVYSCFYQSIPVEILIIDNGSTDGTNAWLHSIWASTIHGLWQDNVSVSKCWNHGLKVAFSYSDHCLVVNNDIELQPNTYERLLVHGGEFVTGVGVREWPATMQFNSLDAMKTVEGQEALDKVKISHFLRKGYNITGIVHVGANDGYEVQWYRKLGISPILCFEPLPLAIELFKNKYSEYKNVFLQEYALGEKDETGSLSIAPNDGQGSSFLIDPKANWNLNTIDREVHRFDKLFNMGDTKFYNCLVVDTQGMELQVLKGFGKLLDQFDYLNIECSEVPLYEGEAPASEVIAYLKERGFSQDTPTEPHNDIMFIRHPALRETRHPDFSCFLIRKSAYERVGPFPDEYEGAFFEDNCWHARAHKAGVKCVSIDVPFLHHGSATIKNMNPVEQARLKQKIERNRERFHGEFGCYPATKEYDELFT